MRRRRLHWIQKIFSLGAVAMLMGLLMLPGCGGGGGGGDGATGEEITHGELAISLADATGDFASYTVDVVSISLEKLNGATIETLPMETRVDFAQYTDMTEFVTTCTIPSGVYVKASLTLDYSNADIRVEGSDGVIRQVNTDNIRDEDDRRIDQITVSVDMPSLLIVPGIPALLALDFNLEASNEVAFVDSTTPTLTVAPLLLVDLEPQDLRIHRLRGALKDVDTDRDLFDVVILPFFHQLSGYTSHFGTARVKTDDETIYLINGASYQGDAGLAVLAQQPADTAILVYGYFKTGPNRVVAKEVYAGTSAPGAAGVNKDFVYGNVIRRSGNNVTIKGASVVRSSGTVQFCNTVLATLNDATVVTRQFSNTVLDTDAISVGQRVMLYGTLNAAGTSMADVDAARLLITHLRGSINSKASQTLFLDLAAIDGRPLDIFTFPATVDPDDFEVNTGKLNVSGYDVDNRVRAWGFMNNYSDASPDFYAQTLINVSEVRGIMHVNSDWSDSSYLAITPEAQKVRLDLANHGRFHYLWRAGILDDLTDFDTTMAIVPHSDDDGLFCIAGALYFRPYTSFESFSEGLEDYIADGGDVLYITATGKFDESSSTLTSRYIAVRFIN